MKDLIYADNDVVVIVGSKGVIQDPIRAIKHAIILLKRKIKELRGQDVQPVIEVKRQCNRHSDCIEADKEYMSKNSTKFVPFNFHCHDDDCEDCFGQ